jgi:hypothetical protein
VCGSKTAKTSRITKTSKTSGGFVLPLVLVAGLLLLVSGLSLQGMALQSRSRNGLLLQEAQLKDGFLSAAMAITLQQRQGISPTEQPLAAGRFRLRQWQGPSAGPAQFSVERLAEGVKAWRSKQFQLSAAGVLRPVSD